MREPLLHFLLLGAGLFVLYGALNDEGGESDPQTIVVDRERLLTYLQYRSRVFDSARFQELLDSLPKDELKGAIQDYVREEALYREAKALQLDRNDYVARRRLIQQLEFITRGFSEMEVDLIEEEIGRYYAEHRDEFYVSPKVTFTHVFFSRERHGAEQAAVRAREALDRLNHERVRFDQAPAQGDRFLYHVNYVGREPEEVTSHFGPAVQQALFDLEPSDRYWRGPFESPYGFHLVLLVQNESGYTPPLEEVRERVEQEAKRAAIEARFEESLQSIVQAYHVKVRWEEFTALQGGQQKSDGNPQSDSPQLARD